MTTMKTLLIMRHAKSDWDASYEHDHDRPLNERGIRSAGVMGRVLSDQGLIPDLVVTSTAVRAKTTAEIASASGGWGTSIVLDETLYTGGVDNAISVILASASLDRLMIVGHQPTWSMLVTMLTDQAADMRTACVAVIDVGDNSDHSLRTVLNPRDYFGTEFDG